MFDLMKDLPGIGVLGIDVVGINVGASGFTQGLGKQHVFRLCSLLPSVLGWYTDFGIVARGGVILVVGAVPVVVVVLWFVVVDFIAPIALLT